MRGPLETRYLEAHPGATTGLAACRFLEHHPGEWFTHAELKAAVSCSDRIIREHLPQALNVPGSTLFEIDESTSPRRFRYPGVR